MRFFFYGTLLDEDLRVAVLGRLAPLAVDKATLHGWRRVTAPGASYPVIFPRQGGRVVGVVARGLDRRAAALLDAYEGDDAYARRPIEVTLPGGRRVEAQIYAPADGRFKRGRRPWSLAAWRRLHKRAFIDRLSAARD